MSNIKKYLMPSLVIGLSIIILGCDAQIQPNEEYVVDQSDIIQGDELVSSIAIESPLSQEEIDGLILMREEEKLAHDVYMTLGEKWGIQIFTNIAKSEQSHTDAVKILLERYNIEDPVKNNAIGEFNSSDLASLYASLIGEGNKSLLDALMVGATIEDLDIKDLDTLLEQTDNADIIATYNNLTKGSRNHMRAFIKQIERNGGTYEAQYITQSELENILSGSQERGRI